jgi:beta-barrel assembly-enhancing protease
MRWLAATAFFVASAVQATPETDRAALLALQATDLRVASVAHRLSTANVKLCPNLTPQLGFSLHALAQYGGTFRVEAKKTFGLGDDPAILAIVPDGAAASAGLGVGDALIAVGATRLRGATVTAKQSYDSVREAEAALDNGPKTRPLKLTIRRDGAEQAINVYAKPGCASRVVVEPGGKLNAYADGTYVKLTSAVAEYTADDGELAAIIAHEMAHNLLAHQARLDATGRSRVNILATEIEADKFSVRLLAGAGYDPLAAARFWARFGKKTGAGIFAAGTHLRTKARVALLEDEAAKLATNDSTPAQ